MTKERKILGREETISDIRETEQELFGIEPLAHDVCPECGGSKYVRVVTQADPPDVYIEDCPTCQGTGKSLNITEAAKRACEEPTLLEALSWICVWESERVVKQARKNIQWETCFKVCLRSVLDSYPKCQGTGENHTPECIRHKAIFGSVGCTCQGSGKAQPERGKIAEWLTKYQTKMVDSAGIEHNVTLGAGSAGEIADQIIALIPDKEAIRKDERASRGYECARSCELLNKILEVYPEVKLDIYIKSITRDKKGETDGVD